MDIDKQILALEGRSVSISLGSKAIFFKIGISLILSLVILYIIRPYYLLNIQADPAQQKCVAKIKIKYFILSSILLAVGIFFSLQRMNIFTD
jgi:hypothetical protein